MLDAAKTNAPILLLDRAEPFRPVRVGVAEYTTQEKSRSSKFTVTPRGDRCVEYAIFWDYDIGHVFDLEHIWVHLKGTDVIAVEATFHGSRHDVRLNLQDGRPKLWCEAGKHAHFRDRAHRDAMFEATRLMCGNEAGFDGVHTSNMFADSFGAVSAVDNRLARLFLSRLQFTPAGGHPLAFDLADVPMVEWAEMPGFIATRMRRNIEKLRNDVPHLPAIFFDCGDTLIDEGTEVKRPDGSDVVIRAELIPGAQKVIRDLVALGYRLCLVADGPRETFENVLKPSGLWDCFEQHVISGDVGVRKPDARMFDVARQKMGLSDAQAAFVPMIGNNLDRDILGANRAGHPSFFFNWSNRRRRVPEGPEEQPTYQFSTLRVLVHLLQTFEFALTTDA